jgi:hypothetical protein
LDQLIYKTHFELTQKQNPGYGYYISEKYSSKHKEGLSQEDSWYSFPLEAESTPGTQYGWRLAG